MAKRVMAGVGARIKRQDEEPRTTRAYVEVYGFIEGLKGQPLISSMMTEDRAVNLAEELLTAARQVRIHNG